MDPAVGLVQAYLRLNGFFTVTEYPIVARTGKGTITLTDVDILAVRFPGAMRWVPGRKQAGEKLSPDPKLNVESNQMCMIIGEVKEGKAKLNRNSYSLPVLETVIRRFGCCAVDPGATAKKIYQDGSADTHIGSGMSCRVKVIVFCGQSENKNSRFEALSLRHVAKYLSHHLSKNQDVFLHTQIKDESLSLIALLLKLGIAL